MLLPSAHALPCPKIRIALANSIFAVLMSSAQQKLELKSDIPQASIAPHGAGRAAFGCKKPGNSSLKPVLKQYVVSSLPPGGVTVPASALPARFWNDGLNEVLAGLLVLGFHAQLVAPPHHVV